MAFVGPISASAGGLLSITGSMSGSTIFHATQITGSHTKAADGQSFIRAGSGITVVSSSNGTITVNYDGTTHSAGGWSDSGTNVTLSTAGDDVGIGVSEPLGKVHIVQDVAEGIVGFKVDTNDADKPGIKFVSAQTTANALNLEAHSITTGIAFHLHSSASNTSARSLLKIHNDHASATAAIPLEVVQDSTGPAIKITGESSTPAQPADGTGYLYAKAGGQLYWRSYDQAESQISAVSNPAADDIGTGDGAVNLQTSSGNVLIDSQAGSTTIDGHTGVEITSTNSGNITLDSVTGIIDIQDGGSSKLTITEGNSGDMTIKLVTNGKDLIFTDNGDAEGFRILDAAAGVKVPGEVRTTGIGYTDGDNAIIIANGGGITAAAGITSTAAANLFGDTSFNDANITNVGSIALDTITNDGTDITIDSSGDIVLDAGGADIILKDDGTEFGRFKRDNSDFVIKSVADNKDIIFRQDDGNEIVRLGNDRRLYFFDKGGEHISSDGSILSLAGGAITLDAVSTISLDSDSGHISIKDGGVGLAHLSASAQSFTIAALHPMILSSSIGAFEFYDDGTKGFEIAIDPSTSDVILSSSIHNKDIIFKGNSGAEVFKVDGSANTLAVTTAATFAAGITSNAGVVVDNITIDGTEIDLSAGSLTLDVAADIVLDADGGNVTFKDDGTLPLDFKQSNSGDWTVQNLTAQKSLIFKTTQGGDNIDVMRIDCTNSTSDVIFNEGSSREFDFRIESGDESHMFYVDGYLDRIGLGFDSTIWNSNRPAARVHIEHTENAAAAATNNLNTFTLFLKNLSTTTDAFAGIAFDVSSEADEDSIGAAIRAERDTSASTTAANHDANLTFATNDAGDDGLTERLRITHDGLVGVATSEPAAALDINDAGGTYVCQFTRNDSNGSASNWRGWKLGGSAQLHLTGTNDNFFINGKANSEVHLASAEHHDSIIWFSKAQNKSWGSIYDQFYIGYDNDADNIKIGDSNTFAGKDLVTIGGSAVTINDDSNDVDFIVESNTSTSAFFVNGAGGEVVINDAQVDCDFRVESNNLTHLLYTDAGNNRVSIGSSIPANTFQIDHTGADGGDGMLIVRADTSTGDGDLLGGIGFDSTDGNVPSTITEASAFIAAYAAEDHSTGDKGGDLVFGTTTINDNQDVTSHEWMRILDSGLVTLQGDLNVVGGDIVVGATADGTDRSMIFGHSTCPTIMGVDDSQDVFAIRTGTAAFTSVNSLEIDAVGAVTLIGDLTVGDDLFVDDFARIDACRIGTTSTDPGDGNLYVEGTITGPTSITTADLNVTDDITMDGANPLLKLRCDSSTNTNESAISFIKEDNTIPDDSYLGSLIWYSDESGGGTESARIRCLSYGAHDTDGTPTDSAGELRIYVTPDAATATTESMRIRTGDGNMVWIDGNISEDGLHTEGHQYYEEGTDIDYGDACVLIDGKIQRSSTAMQKNVCGIAWRKTAQRKIDHGFADLVLENSITGVPRIMTWRDSLGVACNRGKKVGDEWVLDDLYASLWKVASVGDSRQLNDDGGASTQPDLLGFKVCDEGGPIEAGDLLCTSNTSGYLMKQDDDLIHAYTVGKSMEDVTFDGSGQASEVYGYIYCG